jgi:transposase
VLRLSEGVRVFVASAPCDMRKQADGLSALVEGSLGQQPKSGHLFVFFSRRKDFVRILFWDSNGYCTVSKRLEAGTFRVPVPVEGQAAVHVEAKVLAELLTLVDTRGAARPRGVH